MRASSMAVGISVIAGLLYAGQASAQWEAPPPEVPPPELSAPGMPPPEAPPPEQAPDIQIPADAITAPSGQTGATPDAATEGDAEEDGETETAMVRDPFWPVGYSPAPVVRKTKTKQGGPAAPVVPETVVPKWDEALKSLKVTGIMKAGAGYVAVVNGQVVAEKDAVATTFEGQNYSWKVASISARGVKFARDIGPQ